MSTVTTTVDTVEKDYDGQALVVESTSVTKNGSRETCICIKAPGQSSADVHCPMDDYIPEYERATAGGF
jgi:hypothetical protein